MFSERMIWVLKIKLLLPHWYFWVSSNIVFLFFERSLQFSLLLSEMIKTGTSFQHLF